MRQMASQPAFAAADIEDLVPRPGELGDRLEFASREARRRQQSMKIPLPVEIEVKALVAFEHRIEEGEAAGRLPQAEMLDAGELPLGPDAEGPAPQFADQPGADRLDAAARREPGDRAERDGLHRRASGNCGWR